MRAICRAPPVANTQQRRPYANFGEILNAPSDGTSSYNSLQLAMERRVARSISFEANYTWSKSIDIGSDRCGTWTGYSDHSDQPEREPRASDFDIRTGSWLPTCGRCRGSAEERYSEQIGGWESTGILTLQSGSPFSIVSGVDNSRSGDGIDYAALVGNPYLSSRPAQRATGEAYFNTAAFAPNALGTFGTAPRNFIRGPGLANMDFGLMKSYV